MNPNPKVEVQRVYMALALVITAFYPLCVLLSTLNNPNYEETFSAWLSTTMFLVGGTWLAGATVRSKGHQKDSIRIFGIATFFLGIILFFIPLVATILFAAGAGT